MIDVKYENGEFIKLSNLCKTGFVSVLNSDGNLDRLIGNKVIKNII